ncbi:hypothetical protein B0H12DRAFT_1104847 [Mycena haematopus]|nr:hypothetical protein B0H12DRAFT_1104847 [Mycena haematopus]
MVRLYGGSSGFLSPANLFGSKPRRRQCLFFKTLLLHLLRAFLCRKRPCHDAPCPRLPVIPGQREISRRPQWFLPLFYIPLPVHPMLSQFKRRLQCRQK